MTRKFYLSKCPEKNSFFRWRITVRFAVWFQPGRTGFDDGFGAVIPVCSAGIALQVGSMQRSKKLVRDGFCENGLAGDRRGDFRNISAHKSPP